MFVFCTLKNFATGFDCEHCVYENSSRKQVSILHILCLTTVNPQEGLHTFLKTDQVSENIEACGDRLFSGLFEVKAALHLIIVQKNCFTW